MGEVTKTSEKVTAIAGERITVWWPFCRVVAVFVWNVEYPGGIIAGQVIVEKFRF